MNRVSLLGRLTKDLELRRTPSGISYCLFTIAVNRPFSKDQDQQADFISCVAWRFNAENMVKFLRKGSLIALDGAIRTRTVDEQDGSKRYLTEVSVERFYFAETRSQAQAPSFNLDATIEQSFTKPSRTIEDIKGPVMIEEDEDLPF